MMRGKLVPVEIGMWTILFCYVVKALEIIS